MQALAYIIPKINRQLCPKPGNVCQDCNRNATAETIPQRHSAKKAGGIKIAF
jgi:hypothetical protein